MGQVALVLRRLEIDRAVVFAALTRGWQLATGPVTLVLIARFLTPELQGYYYTFASLLGLQTFVELALYLVVINVASHEWAHLELAAGRIVGNPASLSRLASLARFVFRWYAAASVVFAVGVGATGFVFFSKGTLQGWQKPWLVLVALTAALLWMLPFNSLLEGCNQVGAVNRFRFNQAAISSVALWVALALHGGLWVAAAAAAAKVAVNLHLFLFRYRRFLASVLARSGGPAIHWPSEIWPMQWRLALSGLANYFALWLFTPVMFQYHGAAAAGRMGMTWQIVSSLQGVALAWVTTKVPTYGMLIARRSFDALDSFWRRTSIISLVVVAVGAIAVEAGVYLLRAVVPSLAERMLSPGPTALFLLAAVITQYSQCLSAYLRAHKQEPIVGVSVVSSLGVGLAVWALGSRYGASGAAFGYLVVMTCGTLWEVAVWQRCRALWHANASAAPAST